jgi:prepilin-type N-terminal cleavage/methylation domain-containing protein
MSKKAFTLIELAVVLLVIGILAGVVLRNIGGFAAGARDSRRIGDLRNVSVYLSQYFLKNGKYPTATNWTNLETVLRDAGILSTGTPLVNDPLKARSYWYTYCGIGNKFEASHYVIWANLEASNINNAPQMFKDSASGTPSDWGWSCYTDVNCANSASPTIFCLTQ